MELNTSFVVVLMATIVLLFAVTIFAVSDINLPAYKAVNHNVIGMIIEQIKNATGSGVAK